MSYLWAMQIFWTFSIPAGRQKSRNPEVQACRFLQKCLFIMGQPCICAPLKPCCIKAKDMKITCKEEKKIRYGLLAILCQCQDSILVWDTSIDSSWSRIQLIHEDTCSPSWLMIPCHEALILLVIWTPTWTSSSSDPLPAKLLPVKTPNC